MVTEYCGAIIFPSLLETETADQQPYATGTPVVLSIMFHYVSMFHYIKNEKKNNSWFLFQRLRPYCNFKMYHAIGVSYDTGQFVEVEKFSILIDPEQWSAVQKKYAQNLDSKSLGGKQNVIQILNPNRNLQYIDRQQLYCN